MDFCVERTDRTVQYYTSVIQRGLYRNTFVTISYLENKASKITDSKNLPPREFFRGP